MLTDEKLAELRREAELAEKKRLEEATLLNDVDRCCDMEGCLDDNFDGMNCEINDMLCDDMGGDLEYENDECEEDEDDGDMADDVDMSMAPEEEPVAAAKEADQDTGGESEEQLNDTAESEGKADGQHENDDTAVMPVRQDVQDYTKLPSQLNASMAALDVREIFKLAHDFSFRPILHDLVATGQMNRQLVSRHKP